MTSSATASPLFSVLVQPSGRTFQVAHDEAVLAAGIRQGIGLPYGCKDGACGSCKCKLLSGSVQHGPHQDKALSAEDEAAGMVLTCCAIPKSDLTLESRQVTEIGAFPIKKMPVRVTTMNRMSPDVMVVQLQLPANDTFAYRAGQYIEFMLRDGSRRSYSMANAPHLGPHIELHIRHMPGGKFTDHVFGAMKEKEILRVEGPYGSFYLREDSQKPAIFLASGTGIAPIKSLVEHMRHKGITRPVALYWGGASAAGPVPRHMGEGTDPDNAQSDLCSGCIRCVAVRQLDRADRLRTPRRVAGLSRTWRPPGLCLRCSGSD
jgi:CDP-4-dehydro-6-deoxyglucose reductase